MSEALLRIEDLRWGPADRPILRDLSLTIRRGEVFGLLGPNGSGKSTLLSLLCGLREAPAGAVRVGAEPLATVRERWLTELGVVFQSPALDPQLCVEENLQLAAMLRGLHGARSRERIARALDESGLADRRTAQVQHLSGGQRRRLDVARALLHDPRVLILDEPSVGLDEASFRALWERLEARRRLQSLTVIVATHRPEEAARCDRLALLDRGALLTLETPASLLARMGGAMLVLYGDAPEDMAESLRATSLGLSCEVREGALHVRCSGDGSADLPRVLGHLGAARVRTALLRQPNLADAFAALSGRALLGEAALLGPSAQTPDSSSTGDASAERGTRAKAGTPAHGGSPTARSASTGRGAGAKAGSDAAAAKASPIPAAGSDAATGRPR